MKTLQTAQFHRITLCKMQSITKSALFLWLHHISRKLTRLCLPLLGVMALQGCLKEETVAVSVTGYNHIENESILAFSVNGGMGPSLAPYSGGGGFSCCISLPLHWKPGLKATVHWQYGSGPNHTPPPPQSAVADIPEYTPETLGAMQAHFYEGHVVRVVVSRYGLGHPDHPLPEEYWAPWTLDEAVARNVEWGKQQQRIQEGEAQ